MKKYIIILLLVVALIAGWIVFNKNQPSNSSVQTAQQNKTSEETEQPTEETPKRIKIIATGDMIPHDTVNLRANNNAPGYQNLMKEVEPILKDGDITICNQESATAGDSFGISGYPSFNAPVAFAEALQNSGCNVISLANNHVGDRGAQGVIETDKLWRKLDPLAVNGVKVAQPFSYFEVEGLKFAFISFTEFSNNSAVNDSINLMSESSIRSAFNTLRSNEVDYTIVAAHWGNESPVISQSQRNYAKLFSELGADLVIGNGPHVIQEYEIIGDAPTETHIFYSLGNALSTQLGIEQLTGIFAVVELYLDNDKVTVSEIGYLPVYMHYEWSAQQEAAEDLLSRDNLQLVPIKNADQLLGRTRFNLTSEQLFDRIDQSLGEEFLKIYSPAEF